MRHLLAMALLALLLSPSAGFAHGDATTSDPAPGQRLEAVPSRIEIDFSEPPAKDSRYAVRDGCRLDVFAGAEGKGRDKILNLSGGEPGTWTVSYNVISAIDGHQTQDRFTFKVAGTKDCRPPSDDETPGDDDAAFPVIPDDDPVSFPVVPVAIGAAIMMGAVAIRLIASR